MGFSGSYYIPKHNWSFTDNNSSHVGFCSKPQRATRDRKKGPCFGSSATGLQPFSLAFFSSAGGLGASDYFARFTKK